VASSAATCSAGILDLHVIGPDDSLQLAEPLLRALLPVFPRGLGNIGDFADQAEACLMQRGLADRHHEVHGHAHGCNLDQLVRAKTIIR